ncbi:MAG TPA: GNAT family protein [Pirellulales bacterium]|nr:GNAT family protein [Pirellulales bacterium]
MSLRLDINGEVCFTDFRRTDVAALVEGLNDRVIYERTLRIPYPYTPLDAQKWLSLIEADAGAMWPLVGAIRDLDGRLIGSMGLERNCRTDDPVCELGYWLAKPFWGRGIVTAAVRTICRHAFETIGLTKITANVFSFNDASARVLEKCGFQYEGLLKDQVRKDGRSIDVKLFSLLRPPTTTNGRSNDSLPASGDEGRRG